MRRGVDAQGSQRFLDWPIQFVPSRRGLDLINSRRRKPANPDYWFPCRCLGRLRFAAGLQSISFVGTCALSFVVKCIELSEYHHFHAYILDLPEGCDGLTKVTSRILKVSRMFVVKAVQSLVEVHPLTPSRLHHEAKRVPPFSTSFPLMTSSNQSKGVLCVCEMPMGKSIGKFRLQLLLSVGDRQGACAGKHCKSQDTTQLTQAFERKPKAFLR